MNLEEQRQFILSGKMYNDLTPELVRAQRALCARERAVLLSARYNESFGKAPDQREDLLKQLFAKIGCRVYFEPNLRCEFGFNITIGNDFYANFDCIILDGGTVEIGDNVLFGPRVGISGTGRGGGHVRYPYDADPRFFQV